MHASHLVKLQSCNSAIYMLGEMHVLWYVIIVLLVYLAWQEQMLWPPQPQDDFLRPLEDFLRTPEGLKSHFQFETKNHKLHFCRTSKKIALYIPV